MRVKELLGSLSCCDPDAIIEIGGDVTPFLHTGFGPKRSTKRVVNLNLEKGKVIIVCDGSLTLDEEARLDTGLYNRQYDLFERLWQRLSHTCEVGRLDRPSLLCNANIPAGYWHRLTRMDWPALDILDQQKIMLRNNVTVEGGEIVGVTKLS